MSSRTPHHQRGAAALVITLVLFFVMTLIAAYANRNHVFEQRASANQYRAALAFEAAEAGAEWAVAMLNRPQRVGADCLPNAAAATSFRERHVSVDATTGALTPRTWNAAGTPTPLQAACVRRGNGWDCHCPGDTEVHLASPATTGPAPAFMVQLQSAPQPGVIRVIATGCTPLGGACLPAAGPTDAVARVQLLLGWVPSLATPPVAALTSRGAVSASGALGLHNADAASGGVAVHAGSVVSAPAARLGTAAGGALGGAIVESDAALQAMTSGRFFAGFFGVDKALWRDLPTVTRISCNGNCAAALSEAVGSAAHPMIWVEGDLQLDGPVTLGTAQRPVLVVVSGAARLSGAVVFHGLLYAAGIEWNGAAAGTAMLRGAAISETDVTGDAAADLVYDAATLAALQTGSGSFARVPGSWKDF